MIMLEVRNACVGSGCMYYDQQKIVEEGNVLEEIKCKKRPYPAMYIGPNDQEQIDITLQNTPCPLPPQRPA